MHHTHGSGSRGLVLHKKEVALWQLPADEALTNPAHDTERLLDGWFADVSGESVNDSGSEGAISVGELYAKPKPAVERVRAGALANRAPRPD